MKNILLTGEIQVGKTTLLNKILSSLNTSIGGFQTSRIVNNNKKEFFIYPLKNKTKKYKIATIISGDISHKVEPYTDTFNFIGENIIEKDIKTCDVIVLDELGFLESKANVFQEAVFKSLNSNCIVLGVIKPRDIPFLNKIRNREDTVIIEVTKENRDNLLEDILDLIK